MSRFTPDLLLLVPAYNEEKRIGLALARTMRDLDQQGWRYEIIVVDDGSADATSAAVQEVAQGRDAGGTSAVMPPSVRLLRNERNRGKGYSVRRGVLASRGTYIGFADADYKTHIESIEEVLRCFREGCDVAMGSRVLPESRIEREQPDHRRGGGRLFNGMLRMILGMKRFGDTQCGFKAFRSEAARIIFRNTTVDRFGFDVEVLFLAQKNGLSVEEFPVQWYYGPSSTMHVARDGCLMFLDVLRIWFNDIRGKYRIEPFSGPVIHGARNPITQAGNARSTSKNSNDIEV